VTQIFDNQGHIHFYRMKDEIRKNLFADTTANIIDTYTT